MSGDHRAQIWRLAQSAHSLPAEDRQRLGALVRALRVSAGLTQRELSAAVNISAATLRNIERGQLRIAAHLLHSLLAHQSMQQLLEMAIAAAIELAPSGELLPKARR